MSEIVVIMGTRAEIIKMSPIIRNMDKRDTDYSLVFTGQHFDPNMSYDFLNDLKIREFDYDLRACRHGMEYAEVIGRIMILLEPVLQRENPKIVLAQGDTNSTAAAIFTALKKGIPSGHIEAGLRAFDWKMPEEVNRILADHSSQLLFAPTELSAINLAEERVNPWTIFVTGNTIVDACKMYFPLAARSRICEEYGLDDFIIVSVHRRENMVERKLRNLVKAMGDIGENIVFLMHPLTKNKLAEFNLWSRLNKLKNVVTLEGLDYFDTLKLVWNSKFVLTDSGGLQEETLVLDTPCVTLRENTERPETLQENNMLCELKYTDIRHAISTIETKDKKRLNIPNVLGDGDAGEKIVDIIKEKKDNLEILSSNFLKYKYFKPGILKIDEDIPIKDINKKIFPGYVVSIYRDDRALFPQGNLILKRGDIVRVVGGRT